MDANGQKRAISLVTLNRPENLDEPVYVCISDDEQGERIAGNYLINFVRVPRVVNTREKRVARLNYTRLYKRPEIYIPKGTDGRSR